MGQPEYVTRDELDAFAETIAKNVTGAIMMEIGPTLKGIKSELLTINNRLDQLEPALLATNNRLDQLEPALTDIKSDLSAIRNRLDQL